MDVSEKLVKIHGTAARLFPMQSFLTRLDHRAGLVLGLAMAILLSAGLGLAYRDGARVKLPGRAGVPRP
jgi:hypothetical protein